MATPQCITVTPVSCTTIPPGLETTLKIHLRDKDGKDLTKGKYSLEVHLPAGFNHGTPAWLSDRTKVVPGQPNQVELLDDLKEVVVQFTVRADPTTLGAYYVDVRLHDSHPTLVAEQRTWLNLSNTVPNSGNVVVSKDITATRWTDDVVLFAIIKKGMARLAFNEYQAFMDLILCGTPLTSDFTPDTRIGDAAFSGRRPLKRRRFLPFTDTDAYRVLKVATEAFVAVRSVVCPRDAKSVLDNVELREIGGQISAKDIPDNPLEQFAEDYLQSVNGKKDVLPYLALIHQRLDDLDLKDSIFKAVAEELGEEPSPNDIANCTGVLRRKLTCPIMNELIWSYWHEQGMQIQTMYAIRNRFQNLRSGPAPDPLAAMEIGYLRPLNNILWGYIQDEQHRLTILRRCYEYDHHYGLKLQGKAVPQINPADSRVKFLEAFHNLLYLATLFFKEDDDTNIKADGFPVLNAIKEVHFLLSEGAQNQFGDLPTTSRIEMLMEQWLLARPEMQQFLPARESIAYPEEWMGAVDSMKTIQGWTNTSVMYFHDLAVFGEQILLSIRYNNWSEVKDRENAANWARIWRSEIQGYMHAYRTVTGVDISIEPTEPRLQERRLDPSVLLIQRLEEQRRMGSTSRSGMRLPASPSAGIRIPEPRRIGRR